MPTSTTPTGIALMNAFLAGVFGPNRATGSPDAFTVRLWRTDPRGDSPLEADWGGYTPPEWSSDDWLAPDAGVVSSDGLVDFGAPTSAGTGAARYWGLHDTATDDLIYSAPLATPLNITAEADAHVLIRPLVPYGDR